MLKKLAPDTVTLCPADPLAGLSAEITGGPAGATGTVVDVDGVGAEVLGVVAPPAPLRGLVGGEWDGTVAVVALLVVAAAIALIVSSSSSSAPSYPAAVPSGQATTVPTHSPPTGPRNRAAPATTPTTSTPASSTTTVAVAPAGPPVISSLSPASGSAGQSVMVSGANFLSTSGQIVATFNGQVAPTSCPAQNTCTVTVPSSNAPSAQVVITTAGGASNAETFTYS